MTAQLHVEPGTPETGLWCPACHTPAVVKTPLGILTTDGVVSMAPHIGCFDCGARYCGKCDTRIPNTRAMICAGCRKRPGR